MSHAGVNKANGRHDGRGHRYERRPRILIWAGDADGNLGDQAIRSATCDLLTTRLPEARVSIVTRHAGAARELGVHAIRRGIGGLFRQIAELRRSDLVLVGGGGLFQDDDSLVKMPYWAMRILLARALGVRVEGFALGVGPLDHPLSRIAARWAFRAMERVSVRDRRAQRLASEFCHRPVDLLPDPAIWLVPASPAAARAHLASAGVAQDGRPLLGVTARRWFPPAPRLVPRKLARHLGMADPQDGPAGRVMIDRLANVLDRQVERAGARILFLPTYRAPSEADHLLADQIIQRMRHGDMATVVGTDDARLLKACTGLCRAYLGGRMHPLILAAGMGVPLVGLSYNPKFAGFAELIGIEDRIVDVRSLVGGDGRRRLDRLLDQAMDGEPGDPAPLDRCRTLIEAGVERLIAGL